MPKAKRLYQLGIGGKMYIGDAGTTGIPTSELDNVTDVTIELSAAEADVTTRANSGFRAVVAGLKECSISFSMMFKPSDAGFLKIQEAWLTGDAVHIAALTEENGDGPVGDFSVTGFTRSEALEEAIKYDVTLKLTQWEEWHKTDDGTPTP